MSVAPVRESVRRRRDWSARARSSAMDALRYSKFVAWMRRALSLGAFAIIAAVAAFFFVQRQPRQLAMSYEKMGSIENDLAMLKPRLTGNDNKGNPFVITADSAVQDARDTKRAQLTNIEADVATDKASWVNARARHGSIDMTAGKLELTGGIDLFSDSGYELHTQTASVNLGQSVIHGHSPVTGHGPLGSLSADEFHADRETGQLLLTGNVHMIITRAKK